jgi:hypothetical protein
VAAALSKIIKLKIIRWNGDSLYYPPGFGSGFQIQGIAVFVLLTPSFNMVGHFLQPIAFKDTDKVHPVHLHGEIPGTFHLVIPKLQRIDPAVSKISDDFARLFHVLPHVEDSLPAFSYLHFRTNVLICQ